MSGILFRNARAFGASAKIALKASWVAADAYFRSSATI